MSNAPQICLTKVPLFFMAALFLGYASICHAVQGEGPVPQIKDPIRLDISSELGYCRAKLNWNVAPLDLDPNVLSEITFDNLDILQTGVKVKTHYKHLYSRMYLNFGQVIDGRGTDADYTKDDRQGVFSKSTFNTDADYIYEVGVGGGYQFKPAENVGISLLIGLSLHRQQLHLSDGTQTVSDGHSVPPVGTLLGLDSSYRTKWAGWWVGSDLEAKVSRKMRIQSSFEYHQADYDATADWNLRREFGHPISFVHHANGTGFILQCEVAYAIRSRLDLGLGYQLQDWSTSSGVDALYLTTGETSYSRLNQVRWQSEAVILHVDWAY